MINQLLHWLSILSSTAGAFFTEALKRATVRASKPGITFFASSDAATDSVPPGMGGFHAWLLLVLGA